MNPLHWDREGVTEVQRFVAMNEIRLNFAMSRKLRNWKWARDMSVKHSLPAPIAIAEVESPKGNLNFAFARAQMNQDFIGFLRNRIGQWQYGINRDGGFLPIREFPRNLPVFVIVASTYSLAVKIHKQLMLDTIDLPTWLLVEEHFETRGFAKSFYRPEKTELKPIALAFLES